MITQITVSIEVKRAWWLTYIYIPAIVFLSRLGMNPNDSKIEYWVSKGISVKVVK